MWWSLATLVAFQLYFVRELLAAFALFAVGFAALAFAVGSVYMLQKTWEAAIVKIAESQHPAVELARRSVSAVEALARRGLSTVEDLARRPFRGPGSAAAR
jgi:hypothetical protein